VPKALTRTLDKLAILNFLGAAIDEWAQFEAEPERFTLFGSGMSAKIVSLMTFGKSYLRKGPKIK
jgi:hypothetical protein